MRLIVAACLSLCTSWSAWALPFSDVYFFGDSLTDTGNVTAVYAGLPKPPGAPAEIPGPPYDAEGRASNGLLYADVLAAGLGHSATAFERGGTNFAYGGARTRYQLFGPPFLGLIDQVAQYRALPGPADPDALFVVWGGSNNLQDIFIGRTSDPLGQPIPGVADTLSDLGSLLNALADEGARTLLVPNVPNLGRVPRVSELGGPPAQAAATALVQSFNAGLGNVLDGFALLHPQVRVIRFDAFGALEDIVANASSHGLVNLTDRCYTGDDLGFSGGGTVCAQPESYLFWDGIHPTAATHRLLGEAMLRTALVPEPQTWLLMAGGLVLLASLRRAREARRSP